MPKGLRILTMPVDRDGCSWYRVRQPLTLLKDLTPHDPHLVDQEKDDMGALVAALPLVDIFVTRLGSPLPETKAHFAGIVSQYAQSLGKPLTMPGKWVVDLDDNPELISPYSNHYRLSGTQEYFDLHLKKWLWRDGENGFDLAANRKKVAGLIESLKTADLVTVTTDKLADYVRDYNEQVAVLPNAINFAYWWPLNFKPHKQLRVGWGGGHSHYEDWHSIKAPLNRLLRKMRFKLIVMGTYFRGIIDPDLQELVEEYPWTAVEAHSFRTMAMDLDLAIIPLADLPFNHYKSCIKWYEFSALKIPCVVANIPPYSLEIQNGVTAQGYQTPGEFEKAVFNLLHDAHQRKKMGENARAWVFKHRNAKDMAQLYAATYETLAQKT